MRAQNLTISIPADKCDRNCPYCISRITWQTEPNLKLMNRNLRKVRRLARIAGVPSILITCKKEPFMNVQELLRFSWEFSENHWLEVQTNGLFFIKHSSELSKNLYRDGINVVAFSIDNIQSIEKYANAIYDLNKFGIITRICINITKFISDFYNFREVMQRIINLGDVRQVLFRNINYPTNSDPESDEVKWIDNYVSETGYDDFHKQMKMTGELSILRTIPQTGVTTYNYKGISVCFSDYCVQESNKDEDIRSLIFQEDGHVYTSWNYRSSILF